MDKIHINEMSFYGYHGLFPEENKLGQRFIVDVTLYLNLQKAGTSDDMNDSVNYGDVYELTKEIVEGKAKKLIEAVGEKVAQALLNRFSILEAVKVKVTKPGAPIPGYYKDVAIDIFREKKDE
ncbi:dihydroneopterin aldolase [Salirhabdus euzebyi]|uniref:7,8-dihydroneopterin aldolase n=1 Tax=Salirhabdus euzebyi TaxID=394506 RepID=A0A841QA27_9BACI|nr:dihydroneopterin aldolase [Salirhabdus euzebyi]MBB6455270.1 dihydroneopterin aldolase [Salirhabdus euzebyi]